MKKFIQLACTRISIIILLLSCQVLVAQEFWTEIHGPEGGSVDYLGRTSKGFLYALGGGFVWGYNENAGKWEKRSPESSRINRVVDGVGGVLYCYTYYGFSPSVSRLFFSENDGITWTEINWGQEIKNLWLAPDKVIYLADENGTIYKSIDHGENWTSILNMISWDLNLQIDNNGFLYATSQNQIQISRDQGETWSTTLFSNSIYIGKTAVSNDQTIYCRAHNALYRSLDYGISWETLIYTNGTSGYYQFLVSESDQLFETTSNGLFTSIDKGSTWTFIGFQNQFINSLRFPSSTEIYAYVDYQVYYSSNSGQSWVSNPVKYFVNSLLPGSNGTVYARTSNQGIIISNDHGTSWKSMNKGYENVAVDHLVKDNLGKLYAITQSGFYSSGDGGTSWIKNDSLGIIDFRNSNNGTLYAIYGDYSHRSIIYSRDHGSSWKKIPWAHSHMPSRIIVGKDNLLTVVAGNHNYHENLFMTYDFGQTWNVIETSMTDGDYRVINNLYVTANGNWLLSVYDSYDALHSWYRSINQGQTWVDMQIFGNKITVDASNRIYISSKGGFFIGGPSSLNYSVDNGMTWITLDYGDFLSEYFFDNRGFIYLLDKDSLSVSGDGTATWQLLDESEINSMINFINFMQDDQMYAVTYYNQIYKGPLNTDLDFKLINYPNPFWEKTSITYYLASESMVDLSIYNISGHLVSKLAHELQPSGKYILTWDGTNSSGALLTDGIYLCRLKSNGKTQTCKVVIQRSGN